MTANDRNTQPTLDLVKIHPRELLEHPRNRPLGLDEKLITSIEASLRRDGRFRPHHALVVRRLPNGELQIVSGHHRREAALRANVEVLCRIDKEMSDETALRLLFEKNQQTPNRPLDVGLMALAELGDKPARGKKTELAKRLGLKPSDLSQKISAAFVYRWAEKRSFSRLKDLEDRCSHLYEVSRAPEASWLLILDTLTTEAWSVSSLKKQVGRLRTALKAARVANEIPTDLWGKETLVEAIDHVVALAGAQTTDHTEASRSPAKPSKKTGSEGAITENPAVFNPNQPDVDKNDERWKLSLSDGEHVAAIIAALMAAHPTGTFPSTEAFLAQVERIFGPALIVEAYDLLESSGALTVSESGRVEFADRETLTTFIRNLMGWEGAQDPAAQ